MRELGNFMKTVDKTGNETCFWKQTDKISQGNHTGKNILRITHTHTQHVFKLVSGVVAVSPCTLAERKEKEQVDNCLRQGPLDLSFWSLLIFLHHGIEEVERHLL